MSRELVVVPTGAANTASVVAAFARQGVRAQLDPTPDAVREADRVVLPGVGAFGAAAARLDALDLRGALVERVTAGRPTLAICLGLQLFCTTSEESAGVTGLGLVPRAAERFRTALPVPHLGWNSVMPVAGTRGAPQLLEAGEAYFAHTFRITDLPAGWAGAATTYDAPFVSALERGAVLACQFHPEISGAWGARLLARWLEAAPERAAAPCAERPSALSSNGAARPDANGGPAC